MTVLRNVSLNCVVILRGIIGLQETREVAMLYSIEMQHASDLVTSTVDAGHSNGKS